MLKVCLLGLWVVFFFTSFYTSSFWLKPIKINSSVKMLIWFRFVSWSCGSCHQNYGSVWSTWSFCSKPEPQDGVQPDKVAASSCCKIRRRFIRAVGVPGNDDWLEFHVHIHHTQSSSTQQRADKSLRLGRPSAGPRKPLITGPSCLQCWPLIVLSKNRCGYSFHNAPCSMVVLKQTLVTRALSAMLPC